MKHTSKKLVELAPEAEQATITKKMTITTGRQGISAATDLGIV